MKTSEEIKTLVEEIVKEINPYDVVYNCLKQHHFLEGNRNR